MRPPTLRSRPSPRMCWSLVLLAAAGCDGFGGSGESKKPPVVERQDIELRLGVGGLIEPATWNMLRIKVSSEGGDFRGTLEVRGRLGGGFDSERDTVLYQMPLEVPGKGGAPREVGFPVRPKDWKEVRVSLRQPGFEKELDFSVTARSQKDAGAADPEIDDEEAGVPTPPKKRRAGQGASPRVNVLVIQDKGPTFGNPFPRDEAKVRVAKVAPEDLPFHWAAYLPFQLVVLAGPALASAQKASLDALSRWVESGGTLVAIPGPEWAGGVTEEVSKLLGVRCGDASPPPPELASLAAGGFYRSLVPAARTRRRANGLAFDSRPGAGSVTVLSVGPGGETFPGAEKAPALHAALRPALDRALSFAGGRDLHGASRRALELAAVQDLAGMSARLIPDRASVAAAILLYLAAGFFLPAFVFRLLKRPEWTYAAVVVAAVAFTFAIYRYGLLTASRSMEVNEITVLRVGPDEKVAHATSFLGVMAPNLTTVDFLAGRDDASDPLLAGLSMRLEPRRRDEIAPAAFFAEETVFTADRAGRLRMPPARLYPNEMRFFRFDYVVDATSAVESSLVGGGKAGESLQVLTNALNAGTDAAQSPGWDVAVTAAPVFPDVAGAQGRRALTFVVRETPPPEAK